MGLRRCRIRVRQIERQLIFVRWFARSGRAFVFPAQERFDGHLARNGFKLVQRQAVDRARVGEVPNLFFAYNLDEAQLNKVADVGDDAVAMHPSPAGNQARPEA